MSAAAGGGGSGFDEAKLRRATVRRDNAAKIDAPISEWLIGKSATDSKVLDGLWVEGKTLHIAKRQGVWSFDMARRKEVPSRVNVDVDANNIITEVLGWG